MTDQQIAMLVVQKLERIAFTLERMAKILDAMDDRLFEITGNIDAVVGNPEPDETPEEERYYVRTARVPLPPAGEPD